MLRIGGRNTLCSDKVAFGASSRYVFYTSLTNDKVRIRAISDTVKVAHEKKERNHSSFI
jgi:hypothetical protein